MGPNGRVEVGYSYPMSRRDENEVGYQRENEDFEDFSRFFTKSK